MDFSKACAWIANKGSRPKPHAKVQKQQQKSVPTFTPKPDPGPDKPDLTHDIVASKKRTGDDGFMPTAGKLQDPQLFHLEELIHNSED